MLLTAANYHLLLWLCLWRSVFRGRRHRQVWAGIAWSSASAAKGCHLLQYVSFLLFSSLFSQWKQHFCCLYCSCFLELVI